MSKARVAVLKVVTKELSVTAAAAKYGYSRQHLHRLLARYRTGGLEAVDPQSRRPHTNSRALSEELRSLVIELRLQLTREGLDAGPVTIAWHLSEQGHRAPSTSTIRRILHTAELIDPEPRKRPRSSYHRFEAAQPNECWQSDTTHWRLADGSDVEILNWLDDHSRYLIGCTVHAPVTGDTVVTEFLNAANTHGLPASTLTDNGRIYTARFGGGKNAFERTTPATAYAALPKAAPPHAHDNPASAHYRLRYDHFDTWGKVSLRRGGHMHHLGVGYAHRGTRILAIADQHTVTVINLLTAEILSTHNIEPDKNYWRNTQRAPGRWPGAL